MIVLAAAISVVVILIALKDRRRGLAMVIVVGVLQDVMRKLTPGAPTFYILWSMAIFGVVALRAWQAGALGSFTTLWLRRDSLRLLWSGFLLVLIFQCVHAAIRWGPVVAALGMVEYIVPLFAVLFGIGLTKSVDGLGSFLRSYVTVIVPAALSVYLSVWFEDALPVLRDVGTFTGNEMLIYSQNTILTPHSGILRTGEIASWHAASAAVFLIVLGQAAHSKQRTIGTTGLIGLLIGAIIFTGRRKMLMALTIFIALQSVASMAVRSRSGRRWTASLVLALSVAMLPGVLFRDSIYATRGASVYTSIEERSTTALGMARSAYARGGFFGLGLGVFAQGSRYAGVDLYDVVGGAGEAGVGKLILELGVPGLLLLSLILIASARHTWRVMRFLSRRSDPRLGLLISLGSYIVGQVATFSVATQIFGDPFVLIVLGITIGCFIQLLSAATAGERQSPRWLQERSLAGRRPSLAGRPDAAASAPGT
jgi:hypothetical protein